MTAAAGVAGTRIAVRRFRWPRIRMTAAPYGGRPVCPHLPACPPADRADHAAARTVASHPEQGWSLLCNGVIVFDDLGEILPGGPGRASSAPRGALPATRRGVTDQAGGNYPYPVAATGSARVPAPG
jgi:Family of unknown function (DUF5999)